MSFRLEAASGTLRGAFPPELAPLYAAVTALGGVAFLTLGLALLYWVGTRRRETAAVVSYGFVVFAVVVALKSWFAMPRPPEAMRLIAVEGYGFPSGHAAAATVVYGGLALEFGWIEDPRKASAVGVVVVAVALSRVILGVHYLGDVLAGVLVGAVVLVGARAVSGGEPLRGFALGAGFAVAAIAVTGASATALGVLGACLGGVAASTSFDAVPEVCSRTESAVLVALGVPFVVAVELLESPLAGVPLGPAVDDVVLVAGVLLLPAAVAKLDLVERLDRVRSG